MQDPSCDICGRCAACVVAVAPGSPAMAIRRVRTRTLQTLSVLGLYLVVMGTFWTLNVVRHLEVREKGGGRASSAQGSTGTRKNLVLFSCLVPRWD